MATDQEINSDATGVGTAADTVTGAVGMAEKIGCCCLNLGCLFLVLGALSLIAIIAAIIENPAKAIWENFRDLWNLLKDNFGDLWDILT